MDHQPAAPTLPKALINGHCGKHKGFGTRSGPAAVPISAQPLIAAQTDSSAHSLLAHRDLGRIESEEHFSRMEDSMCPSCASSSPGLFPRKRESRLIAPEAAIQAIWTSSFLDSCLRRNDTSPPQAASVSPPPASRRPRERRSCFIRLKCSESESSWAWFDPKEAQSSAEHLLKRILIRKAPK